MRSGKTYILVGSFYLQIRIRRDPYPKVSGELIHKVIEWSEE